jgi:putative ABC transport system ATP-binding protein
VIEARGVEKVFGRGDVAQRALKGVDLRVAAGEFVMLVGPSGSGKTTLLSILGCVLAPTAGEVRLGGEVVTGRPARELAALRRTRLGFVFQSYNLVASLTALENVALALRIRGQRRDEALAEARGTLARVDLADKADRKPAALSGGEAQRVAVARALAGHPAIVLADEPTASLDAASGARVMHLLRAMADEQGTTVVVVTHDPRIFALADRIVRIEDGRIVPDGQR